MSLKENYINLQNASKLCGCTDDHLALLCRQGKLEAERLGKRWYTTKEWLDDYFRQPDIVNVAITKNPTFEETSDVKNTETSDVNTDAWNKELLGEIENISKNPTTRFFNKSVLKFASIVLIAVSLFGLSWFINANKAYIASSIDKFRIGKEVLLDINGIVKEDIKRSIYLVSFAAKQSYVYAVDKVYGNISDIASQTRLAGRQAADIILALPQFAPKIGFSGSELMLDFSGPAKLLKILSD